MRGLNKIVLIGRLGNHPELRTAKDGGAWCSLSVATDRLKKEGDEWKTDTDWHQVRVFGKDAERCGQMLRSGSLVSVEGRMTYDHWQDEEGKKRFSARVLADRVGFLSDLRERASA
ncbi:MAG: single-stranded DNA-binding protein [Alphaproteobacteria bacterium]|nr:single-stranded DNA-binding protein [Alphaproteobacteria bacterium]